MCVCFGVNVTQLCFSYSVWQWQTPLQSAQPFVTHRAMTAQHPHTLSFTETRPMHPSSPGARSWRGSSINPSAMLLSPEQRTQIAEPLHTRQISGRLYIYSHCDFLKDFYFNIYVKSLWCQRFVTASFLTWKIDHDQRVSWEHDKAAFLLLLRKSMRNRKRERKKREK